MGNGSVDGSYIIRGTSDKLYLNVSSDVINYRRATYMLKVVSIAFHMKKTKLKETEKHGIASYDSEPKVQCLLNLVCSGVRTKYLTETDTIEVQAPLCQINLSLQAGENFFTRVNSDYYQLNNFYNGELGFMFKSDLEDDCGHLLDHICEIHVVLKREHE